MTSSEFKVNLFKYMGLDYDTGTMDFNGNIYANTIVAQQFIGNITAGFPSTANIDIVGNVVGNTVVTDSVSSNFYFGNGMVY